MGKPGRPSKDKYNIAFMVKKIEEYTKQTKDEVPILKECCLQNDWNYDHVMRLQRNNLDLNEAVKKLLSKKEVILERGLLNNKLNTTGAIFVLKQPAHGWTDKPQQDITEENENIRPWQIPASMIGKAFVDVNRWIDDYKYNEVWFEGGRGSIKSSFCSIKIIELLENNRNMCAIAMRAVANTINDSIFAQLVWAIDQAGLTEEYRCIKSPHEITKKSTGQKIYFRGLDDGNKIKSIRPPKDMYIGIHWFEEVDQIKGGMSEIRKVEQSLTRGGNVFFRFKSYNTPPSAMHFINKEKLIPKKNRFIHKSDYTQAPIEWLGTVFVEEAEHLRQVNEQAYLNEYMGVVTGVGGMVFTNLDIRPITNEEYEGFDQEYQGLDFGWYPDPNHWCKCYYNANKRILYIADEWRSNKMSNVEIHKHLLEVGANSDVQIIADSANPKDIQDLHDYGLFIKGAKKPPNSVSYSIKWLANLHKIVIDPKCVYTAKEFSEYELEKDKEGNYTSVFSDDNDHSIAAVRYALNNIWMRKGF